MKRRPFLPGQDPRHREAVFALYRTLIREALRVPLPDSRVVPGATHPLRYFIRKRFDSNRSCTSSRLVYAALATGYQFIEVLSKACSASSSEYSRILDYLEIHPYHPSRPKPPEISRRPFSAPRTGLLLKVTKPDGTYKYIPSRPPSEDSRWLSRRLPHMGKTSENQTFIRFRKPQPIFLTRKLIKQRAISVRNVEQAKKVENEMMAAARDEDLWDDIVARQMDSEGTKSQEAKDGIEESYRWSVAISKLWHLWKWEKRWYDVCARGEGYQRLLDEIVNIRESAASKDSRKDSNADDSGGSPSSSPSPPMSIVRIARWESTYPLLAAVKDLNGKIPTEVEADPFSAPYWGLLVENRQRHLAKLVPSLEETHNVEI